MYILSALLFLLGIIVILSPFKTDTIELNGTSTDDEDCKYRNCNNCDEIDDAYCNEDKNDSVDNKDDIDSQIDISEGEVDILPSAETEIDTNVDTLSGTETEIEPDIDNLSSTEIEIEPNVDALPSDETEIETDIDTLPSTETEIEPDVDVLPSDETEIKADTEENIDDNPIELQVKKMILMILKAKMISKMSIN